MMDGDVTAMICRTTSLRGRKSLQTVIADIDLREQLRIARPMYSAGTRGRRSLAGDVNARQQG